MEHKDKYQAIIRDISQLYSYYELISNGLYIPNIFNLYSVQQMSDGDYIQTVVSQYNLKSDAIKGHVEVIINYDTQIQPKSPKCYNKLIQIYKNIHTQIYDDVYNVQRYTQKRVIYIRQVTKKCDDIYDRVNGNIDKLKERFTSVLHSNKINGISKILQELHNISNLSSYLTKLYGQIQTTKVKNEVSIINIGQYIKNIKRAEGFIVDTLDLCLRRSDDVYIQDEVDDVEFNLSVDIQVTIDDIVNIFTILQNLVDIYKRGVDGRLDPDGYQTAFSIKLSRAQNYLHRATNVLAKIRRDIQSARVKVKNLHYMQCICIYIQTHLSQSKDMIVDLIIKTSVVHN